MQDLRRQLDDLKGELTAVTGGAFKEAKNALAELNRKLSARLPRRRLLLPKAEEPETADEPPPRNPPKQKHSKQPSTHPAW